MRLSDHGNNIEKVDEVELDLPILLYIILVSDEELTKNKLMLQINVWFI